MDGQASSKYFSCFFKRRRLFLLQNFHFLTNSAILSSGIICLIPSFFSLLFFSGDLSEKVSTREGIFADILQNRFQVSPFGHLLRSESFFLAKKLNVYLSSFLLYFRWKRTVVITGSGEFKRCCENAKSTCHLFPWWLEIT